MFVVGLVCTSLVIICGLLLTVSFTTGQRKKYPILRKLDGKQLWLSIAIVIFAVVALGANIWVDVKESQTSNEIQAYAFEKLSFKTHIFLTLLSKMIGASSDGWLPHTQEEFFSRRSVDLICNQLNADADAPVIPDRSWLVWFAEETKEYQNSLAMILAEQGSHLSASTVRAISAVERSVLLSFPTSWKIFRRNDQQKGTQRPPLLCGGLEDLFEESFKDLAVLQKEVERGEEKHGLIRFEGWRAIPFPKNDSSVGRHRFRPEDLARWKREHPYAPSGKPPKG